MRKKKDQEDKNIKKTAVRKTPRRKNAKTTTTSISGNINTITIRYIVKNDNVDRSTEVNVSSQDNQKPEDKIETQKPGTCQPDNTKRRTSILVLIGQKRS